MPPFAESRSRIDPRISVYGHRKKVASANPFPGFYLGAGPIGFSGGPAAEPPAGVVAGNTLIAITGSAATPFGYFLLGNFTDAVFSMGAYFRSATGTAADNIASGSCGSLGQIWAFDEIGSGFEFKTGASFDSLRNLADIGFAYPTSAVVGGGADGALIVAGGGNSMTTAVDVNGGPYEKTGERILGGSIIKVSGIALQGTQSEITSGDFPYNDPDVGRSVVVSYRNRVGAL